MKLYPHHIGDFDRATRHLDRIERSIYRDLIELYYDTEKMLPLDIEYICRRIIARTNEESTTVERMLNEFFTKTPTGWFHDRCEEEIDKYRSNNSQRAMAGKASAAKRALNRQQALNGRSTDVQREVNEKSEPITNNHKPITNKEHRATATRLPADWLPSNEDIEFCRTKRPDLNLSETENRFRDYWIAVHGSKGKKLDWSATWRNWVRNEKALAPPKPEKFDPLAYINRNRKKPDDRPTFDGTTGELV